MNKNANVVEKYPIPEVGFYQHQSRIEKSRNDNNNILIKY